MHNYTSINRHKYYLKAHFVFVYKYRKQLLINESIDTKVKEIFNSIESNSDFTIDIMETDKDHIHLLVSYTPKVSISSIVRKLKQESTITLWKYFPVYLSKHFKKNIPSSQMDTLLVQLEKQVPKL